MALQNSDESTQTTPPGASVVRRLMRLPTVLEITGLGRTAWLDMVRERKAPQPIKIGRATMWIETEVAQFVEDRISESRKVCS